MSMSLRNFILVNHAELTGQQNKHKVYIIRLCFQKVSHSTISHINDRISKLKRKLISTVKHLTTLSQSRYISHDRGRPESTKALRVGGWVKPKAYSRLQVGWVGKAQSVCKIQSLQKVRT